MCQGERERGSQYVENESYVYEGRNHSRLVFHRFSGFGIEVKIVIVIGIKIRLAQGLVRERITMGGK